MRAVQIVEPAVDPGFVKFHKHAICAIPRIDPSKLNTVTLINVVGDARKKLKRAFTTLRKN